MTDVITETEAADQNTVWDESAESVNSDIEATDVTASDLGTATSNGQTPPPAVSVIQSPVSINPVVAKYGAAIIQVLLVAFTSFVALGNAPLSTTLLIQLGIAIVGAIGVYLVPLAKGAWAAIWKVIVAVAIAGATAVVPFATTGHLTLGNWIVVGGAVLTALATQLGVSVRTDSDAHLA